ncbi:MAG: hypothetical protein IKH04_02270 [Kiritimatiellae bacterium]|nr:hypothetical protein [Kiritimatiellia bacterium]
MTGTAFFLVLSSAALHASWNLIAKKRRMTIAFFAALASVGAAWSSCFLILRPPPSALLGLPLAMALLGMLAGQFLFAFGLGASYRRLDMSSAYPMINALPLPIVAIASAVFGFGRSPSVAAALGMAAVFAGCLFIPLPSFSSLFGGKSPLRGLPFVLATACGTALYTIADSEGLRLLREALPAGDRDAILPLRWYSMRMAALAPALWAVVLLLPSARCEAADLWRRRDCSPFAAGLCSSLAYVLVIAAMGFVDNVAYVQAFRQMGLVIGFAEGALFLRERVTAPKIAGLFLIIAGLALIAFSRACG